MKYDKDDKLDMVLEILKTPGKAKEIAEKYGIAESTLYKWRSRFLAGGREELLSYKPGPKEKKKSVEETLSRCHVKVPGTIREEGATHTSDYIKVPGPIYQGARPHRGRRCHTYVRLIKVPGPIGEEGATHTSDYS